MTAPLVLDATALERLHILRNHQSVALVGVSANPIRSSNFVASYLIRTSFRTYAVNPAYDTILGSRAYPTLYDLPEIPDIVDIFRRPDAIPEVVDQAIDIGAKVVWLQLGLRHDRAARKAIDSGLKVVQDRCLKIEHARFSGKLHLAGFNTGIVTSKRHTSI